MDEPKYKRVLLKISGEALAGEKHFGLDFQVMGRVADVIKECVEMGVQVGNLSGGQRQAMALLMSTMTPIEFLILDEHTAALDPKTADIIMRLTDRIVKEKKLTTLMVTHNLRYALEYGDRLLMLHEGKAVLDRAGQEKQDTQLDEVLKLFNEISVECGN